VIETLFGWVSDADAARAIFAAGPTFAAAT
jgi:hypothetical protein